jgi:hypothetical protein
VVSKDIIMVISGFVKTGQMVQMYECETDRQVHTILNFVF